MKTNDDAAMKSPIGQLCAPEILGTRPNLPAPIPEIVSVLLGLDRVLNTLPITDGHHQYGHPSGLWEATGRLCHYHPTGRQTCL